MTRWARALVRDVLAVTGLALVGVGCWWIFPPAALIVLGVALVGLAVAPLVIPTHTTGEERNP